MTGNPVPVPVDPATFFRSGCGPVPAKYLPDRTDLAKSRIFYFLFRCFLIFGCTVDKECLISCNTLYVLFSFGHFKAFGFFKSSQPRSKCY